MDSIAFFIPDLRGGGAEKTVVNLLRGMLKQGLAPDLVMVKAGGVFQEDISAAVRIIDLDKKRAFNSVISLSKYLKRNKPVALISHLSHCNIAALLAKKMAGVDTKLVLVEHVAISQNCPGRPKEKLMLWMMKKLYPGADAIVAVAKNTATDIEKRLGLKEGKVRNIYNPVVDEELFEKSKQPLSHPWFEQKEMPVLLAVGRLTPQKDFETLLNAFALVRKQRSARLIILGEGELRNKLEAHSDALGIKQDVFMPGFVANPYSYMAHADVFVLSSLWEGLSNVLIEALACGCAVVSTDCPEGPAEILENGKYGMLVTCGNAVALAEAILQTLVMPVDKKKLVERARYFSVEKAVSSYLLLIKEIAKK